MKISGIYQIQSKIHPERIYIGSAINIYGRWSTHLSYLKRGKHHSSKLQHHYDKYGKDDLIFSIIAICDIDELTPIKGIVRPEQFFIWAYNPWFNICKIAGNVTGRIASAETRKKLSVKAKSREPNRKGVTLTAEHKHKLSEVQLGENNTFFGKKHTAESNLKRTEWNLLHPLSKESREKGWRTRMRNIELKKLKEVA